MKKIAHKLDFGNTPLNGKNPFFEEMKQKQIGFSPLVICSFFEGFDVLQVYSEISKEYVYAIYWAEKLVGHIYMGEMYSDYDIIKISEKIFPPNLSDLDNYINKAKGIWYHKYPNNHYAFILDKVLKKIK
ncbi:MAG: hypothetical protein CSA38_01860 [Flavobacteriales bacterium]|nr:MAG: hypothetical protein CSA38_01860 [Flavobacteriales bacterium]